jgi:hypothetical protein
MLVSLNSLDLPEIKPVTPPEQHISLESYVRVDSLKKKVVISNKRGS